MGGRSRMHQEGSPRSDHLLIIGGGSAAFAAALKAAELGARATIVNDGLPIGGTCVNVGCVPSKTLIRAAEVLHRANRHRFLGIESSGRISDFRSLVAQKRELVESLRRSKYLEVIADLPEIQIVPGFGRLTSPNSIQVDGRSIRADRILIATGSRPSIPRIPGLAGSGYLTSESAFELDEVPESLIVLGGRYVALETAQLFARLGSRVTVLQRSSRILPGESPFLTGALTQYFREEGIEVVTGVALAEVRREGFETVVRAEVDGTMRDFRAARLLAATGRKPNTADLGLEEVGVAVNRERFIEVDETLQTRIPGIYASGDVIGSPMFVYTAAYEGALAAENALGTRTRSREYGALPWVIFTDPQVAGVGLDERQAAERNIEIDVAVLPLSEVPRAIAARDTRGFIQLVRDKQRDVLVGARILAPEGAELLMEIALAIQFGITVQELASSFHPYLTLSEGVRLAAIAFDKDVKKLSCCSA